MASLFHRRPDCKATAVQGYMWGIVTDTQSSVESKKRAFSHGTRSKISTESLSYFEATSLLNIATALGTGLPVSTQGEV